MNHAPTDKLDWQEVHRRLECARLATDRALSLTAEQARAVLEERARALARAPVSTFEADERIEVVTFSLGTERYVVEARFVRGVLRAHECTPIPGGPTFLRGVVNLRGDILAVVDLKTLLGVQCQEETELARILVLGEERAELGIWTDGVDEVRSLPIKDILEPPITSTGIGRDWLRGVTVDATIVLDAAALLQSSKLIIDEGEEVDR